MRSTHSAELSIAPFQRYTLRAPGRMLTQAARCSSTSTRAIFSASSADDAVLMTTILSVICNFRDSKSHSDVTIYSSGTFRMSAAKLSYVAALIAAAVFAALTLGGPQGVPALIQKN